MPQQARSCAARFQLLFFSPLILKVVMPFVFKQVLLAAVQPKKDFKPYHFEIVANT